MEFRDLKRQYLHLKEDLDAALTSAAASGTYIGGPSVKKLEEELAEYVGVKHCVSCANGTDALTLALKVWGVGPGDAVFVPDFTFFSSAETVAAEGAFPVFVDVYPDTFNIDVEDLEKKVRAVEKEGKLKPRVIVAVDLFGQCADYPAVMAVADRHSLLILEDGAQGFGGNVGGCRACSFGDISTTSFFPAKPLGCYGDGGALFTDNDEWAELAGSYKVHGKGAFKYDNVRIGLNSRLDAVQAAVLLVKFKAFREKELEAVSTAAATYTSLLSALDVFTPMVPDGFGSSWAQYTIRLKDKAQRDSLQAFLKAQGIPSMVYYPTGMHAQTAFAQIGTPYGPCPVSEQLCGTVLSLPIHPYITEEEINTVVKNIEQYLCTTSRS